MTCREHVALLRRSNNLRSQMPSVTYTWETGFQHPEIMMELHEQSASYPRLSQKSCGGRREVFEVDAS